MLAPPLAPSVRHWLPGAARLIAVACPACGDPYSLVYSLSDAYVACTGCGWQRRLPAAPHGARLSATLAAGGVLPWKRVLADIATLPADSLPPVPALLWRQTGPTTWQGPSRTQPDTTYTITRYPSGHVHCSCPHFGRGCWHRQRCAELGCVDLTAASDLWPD